MGWRLSSPSNFLPSAPNDSESKAKTWVDDDYEVHSSSRRIYYIAAAASSSSPLFDVRRNWMEKRFHLDKEKSARSRLSLCVVRRMMTRHRMAAQRMRMWERGKTFTPKLLRVPASSLSGFCQQSSGVFERDRDSGEVSETHDDDSLRQAELEMFSGRSCVSWLCATSIYHPPHDVLSFLDMCTSPLYFVAFVCESTSTKLCQPSIDIPSSEQTSIFSLVQFSLRLSLAGLYIIFIQFSGFSRWKIWNFALSCNFAVTLSSRIHHVEWLSWEITFFFGKITIYCPTFSLSAASLSLICVKSPTSTNSNHIDSRTRWKVPTRECVNCQFLHESRLSSTTDDDESEEKPLWSNLYIYCSVSPYNDLIYHRNIAVDSLIKEWESESEQKIDTI